MVHLMTCWTVRRKKAGLGKLTCVADGWTAEMAAVRPASAAVSSSRCSNPEAALPCPAVGSPIGGTVSETRLAEMFETAPADGWAWFRLCPCPAAYGMLDDGRERRTSFPVDGQLHTDIDKCA